MSKLFSTVSTEALGLSGPAGLYWHVERQNFCYFPEWEETAVWRTLLLQEWCWHTRAGDQWATSLVNQCTISALNVSGETSTVDVFTCIITCLCNWSSLDTWMSQTLSTCSACIMYTSHESTGALSSSRRHTTATACAQNGTRVPTSYGSLV